jgi:hypothetical protein
MFPLSNGKWLQWSVVLELPIFLLESIRGMWRIIIIERQDSLKTISIGKAELAYENL